MVVFPSTKSVKNHENKNIALRNYSPFVPFQNLFYDSLYVVYFNLYWMIIGKSELVNNCHIDSELALLFVSVDCHSASLDPSYCEFN